MPETYELLGAMAPTPLEKRRIQRMRGYKNVDSIYKECEPPEGSGRRNCLDAFFMYLDHALVHHPDAALAAAQVVMGRVTTNLSARAQALPLKDLVALLQPNSERESVEAVQAFSRALRQVILGGRCDGAALLREVEDAVRELTKAAVMLRAGLAAEVSDGQA